MSLKRSHYCQQVTESLNEKEVILCGWVDRWRDHGGVVFIDLRDRKGIAQVVFDPAEYDDALKSQLMEPAGRLRSEWVIAVKGTVRARPEGMTNDKLETGKVEVLVSQLEVLSEADPLPFPLHEDSPSAGEVDESVRLRYRYLDLRRRPLQRNLQIRHELLKAVREFYHAEDFIEIETPVLYKSTPEGARDYLVPSRLYPGEFFALPQSPQTLKQLCMVSGFEKYLQIVRCFRDEDLRADRQPEFTQIDVEMSFIDEEDIFDTHERMMKKVVQDVMKEEIPTPFPRLTYAEAMGRFGSDKPDLRNPLELVDLSDEGKRSSFKIYQTILEQGGLLKGLFFEEKEPITRKELDALPKMVAPYGAKGVSWVRIKAPGDWQAPQAKFFDDDVKSAIEAKLHGFNGAGMLLMVCGSSKIVNASLDHLRQHFGKSLDLYKKENFNLCWVTDFPLYQYSDEDKRLYAAHHPFTSVHRDDLQDYLETNDVNVAKNFRARAYDLVMNGYEAGGGSIRIHDAKEQEKMFDLLQIDKEEQRHRFGFFMDALKFGTPPHGGIALGVDRVAMVLAGTDAIRDVIAFPKTQKATDLMAGAPSTVSAEQLRELSLKPILSE